MKKLLDKLFLDRFKNDGVEESYNQAKALVYILLVLNVVILLLTFVISGLLPIIFLSSIFIMNLILLFIVAYMHNKDFLLSLESLVYHRIKIVLGRLDLNS